MQLRATILSLTSSSWTWWKEKSISHLNSFSVRHLAREKRSNSPGAARTLPVQTKSLPVCEGRSVTTYNTQTRYTDDTSETGMQMDKFTDRWRHIQTSVSPCSVVFEGLAACVGQLFIKHRLPASFSWFLIGCCRKTVQSYQNVYWCNISVYWCSIFDKWCCISVYSCSILDLWPAYHPPPSLSLSLVVCLSWPHARQTSGLSGSQTEHAPQTDTQMTSMVQTELSLRLKFQVGCWNVMFNLVLRSCEMWDKDTGDSKVVFYLKLVNYTKQDGPEKIKSVKSDFWLWHNKMASRTSCVEVQHFMSPVSVPKSCTWTYHKEYSWWPASLYKLHRVRDNTSLHINKLVPQNFSHHSQWNRHLNSTQLQWQLHSSVLEFRATTESLHNNN